MPSPARPAASTQSSWAGRVAVWAELWRQSPGAPNTGADAETSEWLRLPKPPGIFRMFFGRHPWIVDWLVVVVFALPAGLFLVFRGPDVGGGYSSALSAVLAAVGWLAISVALRFRRSHPLVLIVVVAVCMVVVFPHFSGVDLLPAVLGLYAVAVYSSARAAWISLASIVVALAVGTLISTSGDVSQAVAMSLSSSFLALIATLIGVNVGNRKRYVEALVDRAAQLARERDQQAQLATASERARIAREMHDIVAHSLTVMVALADGAELTAERDPARAADAMRTVAETGRSALSDMRVVLGVLAEPEGAGLAPQPGHDDLEPLIQSYREAGMVVHFSVSGAPTGESGVQVAVFRVLQEALTNSLRYAPNPKHVTAALVYSDEEVVVRVNDVGQAPTAAVSVGSGRGIIGMQQRVAVFGGTLAAGPTTAGGWQVLATIPLRRRELPGRNDAGAGRLPGAVLPGEGRG